MRSACAKCADKYDPAKPRLIGGEEIDRCIRGEVRELQEAGIRTVCSCCGHGLERAGYIAVDREDREKMIALGYEERAPRYAHCTACGVFFRPKDAGKEEDADV